MQVFSSGFAYTLTLLKIFAPLILHEFYCIRLASANKLTLFFFIIFAL